MTAALFTDEQVAEALRDATPVDPAAVQRAQARAGAALDVAFAPTLREQPWER
ncbi:hypothetical protein H7J71_23035 [Mycolicibacterium peregrinum]|uniref:hypothetical protein n=1 Tax=Mycolicibacterium peregrinum TaxID=43304 RepID=UPI000B1A91EC|nr:hypothetical protein [Mycolicibacterium peregrinum]MCV7204893.1 hypothetical protein [Mycolicibacterium peregrinum]